MLSDCGLEVELCYACIYPSGRVTSSADQSCVDPHRDVWHCKDCAVLSKIRRKMCVVCSDVVPAGCQAGNLDSKENTTTVRDCFHM